MGIEKTRQVINEDKIQVINEDKPSMITFDEVNQSEAQLEHSSPQPVESSIDPTNKDNVIARKNMTVRNVESLMKTPTKSVGTSMLASDLSKTLVSMDKEGELETYDEDQLMMISMMAFCRW